MENPNTEQPETVPAGSEPQGREKKKNKKRSRIPLYALLGILFLAGVAAISAFSGYNSAISMRTAAQATQVAAQADEQFALGIKDMEAGQYFRAQQRFEYVAQIDPSYPGVTEKLSEVLLELRTTATPTVAPTPTLTPTPDTRGQEEKVKGLFEQAQQSLANSDWSAAIGSLLDLRKVDPNYRPVDVDGMLFLAYRNRGRQKIVNADLEGGIYDLALAERFGPLDAEAQGLLTFTRMYITGASFWEIDWGQAVYYLAQVAPYYPSLTDGSGMTASERYRQALAGYGDQLAKREEWCSAAEQYTQSLAVGSNAEVEEALNEATKNCNGLKDEEDNGGDGQPVEATADPGGIPEVPTPPPPAP